MMSTSDEKHITHKFLSRAGHPESSSDEFVVNGKELLLDWPADNSEESRMYRKPYKQLRFSDLAMMRLYIVDGSSSDKSYTKEDRIMFSRRVICDARKIRNAIASNCDIGCITSNSIATLEACGVLSDEVVGLETFIFERSPADVAKLRRLHSRTVLLEQEKQRLLRCRDENRIAKASRFFSTKSAEKARIRAALAA